MDDTQDYFHDDHQTVNIGANNITENDLQNTVNGYSENQTAEYNPTDTSTPAYHKSRWKRLKRDYNDQYLNLFNSNRDQWHTIDQDTDLVETQIGAVSWTPDEKVIFFEALGRVGRHDIPRIAEFVRTKSQLEVRAYLDSLRTAHVNRQLYEKDTKNVSHAEIPAAVEIGEDCDQTLDKAADALSAFQDQYDAVSALQQHGTGWLIDRPLAAQLDSQADDEEAIANGSETQSCIFKLTKFLDLSESFFMNMPSDSLHDHWSVLVEPGQRPAMTQDTMSGLHNLVVSLTQRVLQVTIFMAKTRIRANTRSDHVPVQTVIRSDVEAALNVMKMKHDSWDYWTRLARRSAYNVVSGSHKRGESSVQQVSYDDVESLLSIRKSRGRRRSMSLSTDKSISETSDRFDPPEAEEEQIELTRHSEESYESQEEEAELLDSSPLEIDTGSESEFETVDPTIGSARTNRSKRIRQLEEAQDEYMERLDRIASAHAEGQLREIMSKTYEPHKKQEEVDELGPRPKTLRKDREELQGWICTYRSEWEQFGEPVPSIEFADHVPGNKRKAEASDEE